MKYRYAFFDLDGTLTQSEFGIIASAKYSLSKFGIIEDDRDKLLKFIGPPLYYSFDKFYGITGSRADDAIRYYREYYEADAYKDAPLYEGISEVLAELKSNGCSLCVVTAKPERMAKRVIEYTSLNEYFDHIVGPDGENKTPSKSDLIKTAVNIKKAPLSEIVMIGDRNYDIDGANEVGVDSIGAVYGYGSRDELLNAGATYLAETPVHIGNIILEKH